MTEIQEILERQPEALVGTGVERAEQAADAHIHRTIGNFEGTIDPDPVRPGFEVEQQETAMVLEISRLLRTRANEQDQEATQTTTNRVAIAAVMVAAILGLVQICISLLSAS